MPKLTSRRPIPGQPGENAPPRIRTSSDSFEDCHASITPAELELSLVLGPLSFAKRTRSDWLLNATDRINVSALTREQTNHRPQMTNDK